MCCCCSSDVEPVCFRVETELLENVQLTERETVHRMEIHTLKVINQDVSYRSVTERLFLIFSFMLNAVELSKCLYCPSVLLQGALERQQLDRQRAEEEAADAKDALQKVRLLTQSVPDVRKCSHQLTRFISNTVSLFSPGSVCCASRPLSVC